jgi:hypothetical protein
MKNKHKYLLFIPQLLHCNKHSAIYLNASISVISDVRLQWFGSIEKLYHSSKPDINYCSKIYYPFKVVIAKIRSKFAFQLEEV